MALVGPESRCPICDGLLDRPFTATSGVAFPRGHRLWRYCDAPLHFDCLAAWPDREEFSRAYFVSALANGWRGRATILRATARWFLACGLPSGAAVVRPVWRVLATLWGAEASQRNWKLLDAAERAYEQRLEEEERARTQAIAESNTLAQRLLLELEIRGSLLCPHCHQRAHRVRFVERSPEEKSYFICGLCARSFAGSEASA